MDLDALALGRSLDLGGGGGVSMRFGVIVGYSDGRAQVEVEGGTVDARCGTSVPHNPIGMRATLLVEDGQWVVVAVFGEAFDLAYLDNVVAADDEFYSSTSPTVLAGGQWVDYAPGWAEGRYVWTRTRVTRNDGSTYYSPSEDGVCISGNTGPQGADGTGVTILGSFDTYAALVAAHPTGNPGDSYMVSGDLYVWSESAGAWKNVGQIQGPQGPAGPTGPQGPAGATGATGPQGATGATGAAGVGVSGSEVAYQTSASGTTVPTSTWHNSVPSVPNGYYLWTRTITRYTDGTSTTAYSVARAGTNGVNGVDGSDGRMLRGSSTTAAATAAKVASCEGFSLYDGVSVAVTFTSGNVAASPTLNVAGTGAKPVYTNGVPYAYWAAGATVLFVYNAGTGRWHVASSPVYGSTSTIGNPAGANVYTGAENIEIRDGATANARFSEDKIELGINSEGSAVEMCAGKAVVRVDADPLSGGIGAVRFGTDKEDTIVNLVDLDGTGVRMISNLADLARHGAVVASAQHVFAAVGDGSDSQAGSGGYIDLTPTQMIFSSDNVGFATNGLVAAMKDWVVESSTADSGWKYAKFASGLAVCAIALTATPTWANTSCGLKYSNYSYVYPFAFAAAPVLSVTPRTIGILGMANGASTTNATYALAAVSPPSGVAVTASLIAVGRWK